MVVRRNTTIRLVRAARYALFAANFMLLGRTCQGGFTFLPPSPYLSAADSPFPVLTDPSFHLEDFESDPGCVPGPGVLCGGGMFDAPGVRMIYGNTGPGASVDSDDGAIDGLGAAGASAVAVTVYANPDLTFYYDAIEFEFDASELGGFPTAVGFTLTDGAGSLSSLRVFDSIGHFADYDTTGIELDSVTTEDDRFLGVTNPIGISRISFGKTTLVGSGGFHPPRLDHLQYGQMVPEPRSEIIIVVALVAILRATQSSLRQLNAIAHHFRTAGGY